MQGLELSKCSPLTLASTSLIRWQAGYRLWSPPLAVAAASTVQAYDGSVPHRWADRPPLRLITEGSFEPEGWFELCDGRSVGTHVLWGVDLTFSDRTLRFIADGQR